jgi:hypothetical protein
MSDDLVKRVCESSGWSDPWLLKEAADRIEKLEKALHCISLGSQDSGTTKEGLGREARKALEGKDD